MTRKSAIRGRYPAAHAAAHVRHPFAAYPACSLCIREAVSRMYPVATGRLRRG